MRWHITSFLFLVVALLAAFVFWVENELPDSKERALQRQWLWNFSPVGIQRISIENQHGKATFRNFRGVWKMTEPYKDRLHPAAVNHLVELGQKVAIRDILPFADMESELRQKIERGFRENHRTLLFHGAGGAISFGGATPLSGTLYAQKAGGEKYFIVSDHIAQYISQPWEAFRARDILDLDREKIVEIEMMQPLGKIALERSAVEGEWAMRTPLRAPVDAQKVTAFLDLFFTTPIEGILSAELENNGDALGAEGQRYRVRFRQDAPQRSVVLEFGPVAGEGGESVLATISNRPSTFLLPEALRTALQASPHDFRSRELLNFNPESVVRCQIQWKNEPALTWFVRNGVWFARQASGQNVDALAPKIAPFLSQLRQWKVAQFVSDAALDLAPYGLDEPAVRISLRDSQWEEGVILELALGIGSDDNLYTQRRSSLSVFRIDPQLLASVPRDMVENGGETEK